MSEEGGEMPQTFGQWAGMALFLVVGVWLLSKAGCVDMPGWGNGIKGEAYHSMHGNEFLYFDHDNNWAECGGGLNGVGRWQKKDDGYLLTLKGEELYFCKEEGEYLIQYVLIETNRVIKGVFTKVDWGDVKNLKK